MSCNEIRGRLAEYAVDGLGRWRRARVHRHLHTCAACRAELAALERTGALLSQVGLESAPESVWQGIRYRLESPARPRLRAARPVGRLVEAAALVVVLFFVGLVTEWPAWREPTPIIQRVVTMDKETRSAEEGHLSAAWSAPLTDEAAMGLRLESVEDNS